MQAKQVTRQHHNGDLADGWDVEGSAVSHIGIEVLGGGEVDGSTSLLEKRGVNLEVWAGHAGNNNIRQGEDILELEGCICHLKESTQDRAGAYLVAR